MGNIILGFKQHWRLVAIIVGGLLIVASAVYAFSALGSRRNGVTQNEPPGPSPMPASTAKTYIDLYAVSIDNNTDARPPSGLNQAAIIFEAPVEGGITRFLAVFERGVSVPEIGPVRSARPYFLDWVSELGPSLFLHIGGSPAALERIAATPYLREADRDGISTYGSSFWRDGKRDMPHNAYTSSTDVEKLFSSRTGASRSITPYLMAGDPPEDQRGSGENFIVPMSAEPSFRPEWRYDKASNSYTRFIKGVEQDDRVGAPLTAKNIIVMKTTGKVLDGIGRLSLVTAGSGDATVYHDGAKIDATWKNGDGSSLARFYATDGSEIALTEGSVWIEMVWEK
jgi:hypothetical protein